MQPNILAILITVRGAAQAAQAIAGVRGALAGTGGAAAQAAQAIAGVRGALAAVVTASVAPAIAGVRGALAGTGGAAAQAAQAIAGVRGALAAVVTASVAPAIAVRTLTTLFKTLAVAVVAIGFIFKATGSDERMYLMLRGLTHSSEIALSQIRAIRQESEKGLFDKDELFEARKLFDATGASIKELLPLAEELSLRSDKGLGEVAKVLGGLSGGGMARIGLFLRAAGLTVNELRNAGLSISKNYQVTGSPEQVLRTLKQVLGKDNLSGALGGGLSASLKGTFASLMDLFRSIGDGLMPIIKPILAFTSALLRVLIEINDITHGWIGNILLAIGALRSMAIVIPIVRSLALWQRAVALWTVALWALNNPWIAIRVSILGAVSALRAFVTAQRLAAFWQGVINILSGNWMAIVIALVAAFAVLAVALNWDDLKDDLKAIKMLWDDIWSALGPILGILFPILGIVKLITDNAEALSGVLKDLTKGPIWKVIELVLRKLEPGAFDHSKNGEQDGPAAERPSRRSDIENEMDRRRARRWA